MRIYEIAKKNNINSKELIKIICEMDILPQNRYKRIANHMDVVPDQLIPVIEERIREIKYSNKSPIKYIKIYKLFGQYNYFFDFDKGVNIWVSENGKGKTTILNIISATLSGNVERLISFPFEKIEIKVKNKEFSFEMNEFINYNDILNEYIKSGIVQNKYLEFVHNKSKDKNLDKYSKEKYNWMITSLPKELSNSKDIAINIKKQIKFNKENELLQLKKIFQDRLLFLPTFRRVEAEIEDLEGNCIHIDENNNSQINFGMKDVENIINNKTNDLKDMAFKQYSELSANVINDLINNNITIDFEDNFDSEKAKIILNRIGLERVNEKSIYEYIDCINSKDIQLQNRDTFNNVFFRYYINKLLDIYENQKPIDDKIKAFKEVCNKYLIDKYIEYDESLVKLSVKSSLEDNVIQFSSLSSGEKQIISIFAKLYLEVEKPIIFMIDEPELSLSIEWQKMLLQDIYNSGNVSLLIATTHSPFIFKNPLGEFVKDLEVYNV